MYLLRVAQRRQAGRLFAFACVLIVLSCTTASAASVPLDESSTPPTVTTSSELHFPLAVMGIGQPIYATRVGTVSPRPTYVTAPPGDSHRLFVTSQVGRVRIVRNGTTLPTPFLDIADRVSCCWERGLLSLAFHPAYAQNGYFYVAYVDHNNNLTVVRYTVSDHPDVADPSSAFPIVTINHPSGYNHYGGQLQFGPDGYLYIGVGDGADPGDPYNNSQNPGSLLGKIWRIDVNHGTNYAIPPTNPFVGPGDPLDEIWSLGLRNPWRFSFDPLTHDLWIGDVGQRSWEEIDFVAAGDPGGRNLGWDCYEGTHTYDDNASQPYCQGKTFTWPVYEYAHSPTACAVTGGYVYRAAATSAYYGTYVFADYCASNLLYTTRRHNAQFTTVPRSLRLPEGKTLSHPSSFGMDGSGKIYVADWEDGDIFRIEF